MANLIDTKAAIVTLAQQISGIKSDSTYVAEEDRLEYYFDAVVAELAKGPLSPLSGASQVQAVSGTATYDWPASAERLITIFHESTHLSRTAVTELEAMESDWRDDSGAPWAWLLDRQTARKFMAYPIPDATGDAVAAPFSWNASFPDDDFSVIYSESRESDLADWLCLWIAFSMLEREFTRVSDHQDLPFSDLCKNVAQLLESLIGIYQPEARE